MLVLIHTVGVRLAQAWGTATRFRTEASLISVQSVGGILGWRNMANGGQARQYGTTARSR